MHPKGECPLAFVPNTQSGEGHVYPAKKALLQHMGPIRWIRTIRWSLGKHKTYNLRIDVRIDFSQRIDPLERQLSVLSL